MRRASCRPGHTTAVALIGVAVALGGCGGSDDDGGGGDGGDESRAPAKKREPPAARAGVPVRGGGWEVTLRRASIRNRISFTIAGVQRTTYTPKGDRVFVVVSLKLEDLRPERSRKISSRSFRVVLGEGVRRAVGAKTSGGYCICTQEYGGLPGVLSTGFVFELRRGELRGPLRLRFDGVPEIPFTVKR
jgi:hypothetical protein